jgi:hypothetical protein
MGDVGLQVLQLTDGMGEGVGAFQRLDQPGLGLGIELHWGFPLRWFVQARQGWRAQRLMEINTSE